MEPCGSVPERIALERAPSALRLAHPERVAVALRLRQSELIERALEGRRQDRLVVEVRERRQDLVAVGAAVQVAREQVLLAVEALGPFRRVVAGQVEDRKSVV